MESFLLLFLLLSLISFPLSYSSDSNGDAEALLALKSDIDPYNSLPWQQSSVSKLCNGWKGVKECTESGRVTKLVLESLNLTGNLKSEKLTPLDQLRVLSFKSNSLSGAIPDLTPLSNLKSIYLNSNHFSGEISSSLSTLHRLKIIVLSDNRLSGRIPPSLAGIPRLYSLLLDANRLTGTIPGFRQPGLRYFNVSSNNLTGEIPRTKTLDRFNLSSFLNIPNLCSDRIQKPCSRNEITAFIPSASPEISSDQLPTPQHKSRKKRIVTIVAAAAGGALFLLIAICVITTLALRKKKENKNANDNANNSNIKSSGGGDEAGVQTQEVASGSGMPKASGFSWEGEGLGKLVFCGGVAEMYSLEDLLKASAETLGRGTAGSTYKAVMESGFIVTVKRLKDSSHLGVEEFRRRMEEEVGRLRHPNLVPLRAFFQAKEERLLVYDYFPNGSLFSLIHGSRPSGSGKPLHWTSCLKIAEDVATGLLYLHESNSVHGNLKSSNVLLGSDFESCLTDYGLLSVLQPSEDTSSAITTSSAALFYRAPECRNKPFFTPQSDIYSFGVLLLELLTGKTPFQDLVEEHGADIPQWVKSVREEETESTGDESSEEKLGVLLNIAMTCVVAEAEKRPVTKVVVKMIREARAEVVVSSNSSDHSPGRWSDTVQSLPREYGSEHLSFAERN